MPFLEISATSFTQKKPTEGMLDTSCEHPLQTSSELGKKLRHRIITFTVPTGDSRSISRNVFLCHPSSPHRGIARYKTAPHLSTLRLRGSFLKVHAIWE